MNDISLCVFLGNPGEQYENTRHNAGFMCCDELCKKNNLSVKKRQFRGLSAEANLDGIKTILLKPQTYMNESGLSVLDAVQFYKIPNNKIIVVCDDITQNVGKIRIRAKGSDGGHNGLKSIINLFGENFTRIRIGVGAKPTPEYDLASWVLSKFSSDEIKILSTVFENAISALTLLLHGKLEEAQMKYN